MISAATDVTGLPSFLQQDGEEVNGAVQEASKRLWISDGRFSLLGNSQGGIHDTPEDDQLHLGCRLCTGEGSRKGDELIRSRSAALHSGRA